MSIINLVKSNFKFTSIFLILIIFGGLTSLVIKDSMSNLEDNEAKSEECKENLLFSITQIIFKCGLAFLTGGIISDVRYLKTGFVWENLFRIYIIIIFK